jgi:hypothetical integral membrane protein (TIGR02206 family)
VTPPAETAGFAPFTATHLVAAGVGIAAIGVFVLAGWQASGEREKLIARTWAVLWLVQQAITTVYWLLPASFDVGKSFPLHLCDVIGWLGPFALLLAHTRGTRWLRTVLYFWGIGLSTQAFFTPTVTQGPDDPRFWLFWISHTQIVGAGFYDIIVRDYRPDLRDFKTAIIASFLWMVPLVLLNWATGLNYGYLGKELEGETILNVLPPWPWRLFAMAGIVLLLFTVLWGVWPLSRLIAGKRAE